MVTSEVECSAAFSICWFAAQREQIGVAHLVREIVAGFAGGALGEIFRLPLHEGVVHQCQGLQGRRGHAAVRRFYRRLGAVENFEQPILR